MEYVGRDRHIYRQVLMLRCHDCGEIVCQITYGFVKSLCTLVLLNRCYPDNNEPQ